MFIGHRVVFLALLFASVHLAACLPLLSKGSLALATAEDSYLVKRVPATTADAWMGGPEAYHDHKANLYKTRAEEQQKNGDHTGAGYSMAKSDWHRAKVPRTSGNWANQLLMGSKSRTKASDLKEKIDGHEAWKRHHEWQASMTQDPHDVMHHKQKAVMYGTAAEHLRQLGVKEHGTRASRKAGIIS